VEIRYYLGLLRRWWWVLIAALLVTAVPAYLISRSLAPTYQATTIVFVNVSSGPTAVYQDALLSQQLVLTYSQMTQQPIVLDDVRQRLGLTESIDELRDMISAQPRQNTQLFEISVTGNDPTEIRDIANTIAVVFIEQQIEFLPEGQRDGALRVAQPALIPERPIAPSVPRNVILAMFAGLMLAGIGIMVYEHIDDTIKSPEDLDAAASVPALGMVALNADEKRQTARLLVSDGASYSPDAEAYRLIRTNLDFALVDHPAKTVVVTSGAPGEGKTTTIANLATVMAQAGKKVALVDADLRKPTLHYVFKAPNTRGLSNLLLVDDADPMEFLQSTGIDGLSLITSGPLPPNPTELLASPRLRLVLEALAADADIVLIDSPPALVVADAVILASRAGATVLVVDTQTTRSDALRRSVEALGRSGTRILGGVLNKLGKESNVYYYGYYTSSDENGPRGGSSTKTTSHSGSVRDATQETQI
jgi:capsular exopolysaccharide synthesis family protein